MLRAGMCDDDLQEALRPMRKAVDKQRGYADFFEYPDKDVKEEGIARDLCESLAAAGTPLARPADLVARGKGNDPPDCEARGIDGSRIAIEVTELVDQKAVEAVARGGSAFAWAEWTSEKLRDRIQNRLDDKDNKVLKGGLYDSVVVVIHTDEPELNIARVKALLGDTRFRACKVIDRAFLLLAYDPHTKPEAYPVLELPLSVEPV